MNVVIIPFYSELDMALATQWAKLNGGTHWEDYIKGLDNTITNVNKINLSVLNSIRVSNLKLMLTRLCFF